MARVRLTVAGLPAFAAPDSDERGCCGSLREPPLVLALASTAPPLVVAVSAASTCGCARPMPPATPARTRAARASAAKRGSRRGRAPA
jgi:hypothetical protein